jgi:hypothetical protein
VFWEEVLVGCIQHYVSIPLFGHLRIDLRYLLREYPDL